MKGQQVLEPDMNVFNVSDRNNSGMGLHRQQIYSTTQKTKKSGDTTTTKTEKIIINNNRAISPIVEGIKEDF